jgi:hypothetical protein
MKAYAIYEFLEASLSEVKVLPDFNVLTVLGNLADGPLFVVRPGGIIVRVPPFGPPDVREIIGLLQKIQNDLLARYQP